MSNRVSPRSIARLEIRVSGFDVSIDVLQRQSTRLTLQNRLTDDAGERRSRSVQRTRSRWDTFHTRIISHFGEFRASSSSSHTICRRTRKRSRWTNYRCRTLWCGSLIDCLDLERFDVIHRDAFDPNRRKSLGGRVIVVITFCERVPLGR